ncbi:metal cation transporter, ZIP family [Oesophagostomum dentatum]|uniref:Metal cation transporter, ZIP family n=1 Tax=Oesophagostomum dentatum TaxID=61180 RepID=A0A0B1TDS1_OESDE|nr:metal cation transporter, ZIP family [Oesophagostomum dentatum]
MDLVVLKIILLAVMTIVMIVFGLIPMKILKVLSTKSFERRAGIIISMLSCFAGGVFLGVCFLDLMPDALESYGEWKEEAGIKSEYPFVPLFFMVGFYIVNIIEEVVGKFCGHDHEMPGERNHAATLVSHVSNNMNGYVVGAQDNGNNAKAVVKSLTFVLALMFHASLEGFAFGVQTSTISVTTLFGGIIVHKAVVAFSVGTKLAEAHPHRPWVVIFLIVLVSLVTPLGGGIGIALENSDMDELTKNAVTCILVSLSLGTFIHITFFEVSESLVTSLFPIIAN